MKRSILISILLFFISFSANSQCRDYMKAIAPSKLSPYLLDGNFNAPVVYEGETVKLNRTFLGSKKYKIMVIGMDFFEKKITIKDEDGFILFKNYLIKSNEEPQYYTDLEGNIVSCMGASAWEFELEKSQNLTIIVELEKKAKRKKNRLRGCLGIVVGFED